MEIHGAWPGTSAGLIDLHTHVAAGAITEGVGMDLAPTPTTSASGPASPRSWTAGWSASPTSASSPAHILPRARTRVAVMVNAGSHAHTMPGPAYVRSLDDISRDVLQRAAAHNPGLIAGVKLRIVGPVFQTAGEEIITTAKAAAHDLAFRRRCTSATPPPGTMRRRRAAPS